MQQQNRRINIIIFLLVTFIIVAGNNTTAKAVDSYISGDYEYQLDTFYGENGKTTYANINKYTGLSEIVAVPETIAGYPVWKLENTFAYNQTVSKVIIPSNVKYLNATFTHCDNLKSVVLPSTITDYYFAFQSCKRLTEIEIPGGTYSMFRAFEDCTSLKSVKINGLIVAEEPRDSSIGTCGIFYGCSSLETVSIKSIVGDRNIGDTFYGCDNLKSIEIQESVSNIRKLFNKCTALETVYLPKGLKSINNAFEYCYKLKDIYFAGSECEWNAIKIDVDNPNIDKFKNATIHYSSEGGHIYSEWETTLQATCFKGGSRERHCTICGEAETENIPKLTPVLTVGKKSVKLAKAKSVSLKVSFTSGDSVTAKSSDKKIATVTCKNGKITIKAQKKAGIANITVTTKTGKKAVVKVTVPKAKTTKITCKAVSVKKGKKVTLKPKVTPAYSDDKITYKSANKKIATVTAKGVVKGIKKGKTTITIKSGKKSVKVKVTVK